MKEAPATEDTPRCTCSSRASTNASGSSSTWWMSWRDAYERKHKEQLQEKEDQLQEKENQLVAQKRHSSALEDKISAFEGVVAAHRKKINTLCVFVIFETVLLIFLVWQCQPICALIPAHVPAGSETPRSSVGVYVQRDTQSRSGYKLPTGESLDSVTSFLQRNSRYLDYEPLSDSTGVPLVYITLAASGRLDEMLLDRAQVAQLGKVDAFIFIWITSTPLCQEGDLPRKHRQYVRSKVSSSAAVSFVCYWSNFQANPFSVESLGQLEQSVRMLALGEL
eukprot:TRINITY_DN26017_c0_g1_i2.p1 TRINITY_DN26017_c0_g1~~TRINITY_DN26017_c0_g1_i2.p1  ORF type:complete len:321 (+),score=25.45 TRINITY_DN26017_c0_g1_i2:129-965(+)